MKRGFAVAYFLGFLLCINLAIGASTTSSFDLNSLIIKASVKQGDSASKVLTISEGNGQEIFLRVINLNGVSLSEESFVLEKGSAKNVLVLFNTRDLTPGVYVGSIKIYDNKNEFLLPMILEVESRDVFYDANLDIPPKYSSISPGEKIVAQIKLFDLTSGGTGEGLGVKNLNLEYNVYSIDGKAIVSESETVSIDKQAQLAKTVSFPESIKKGDYVFSVTVKYKSSIGVASYLFSVEDSDKGFGSISSNFKLYAILCGVLAFFFGALWFFVYLIKDRDKIINEMQMRIESDYKRNMDLINRQVKLMHSKGVSMREIEMERKKNIKKLDAQHNNAKRNIERIKESKNKGNIKSMERQLLEWKKRGFNTQGMEYKFAGLTKDEMRKIIKEWKEEYK